jgi:hypothetical protein
MKTMLLFEKEGLRKQEEREIVMAAFLFGKLKGKEQ